MTADAGHSREDTPRGRLNLIADGLAESGLFTSVEVPTSGPPRLRVTFTDGLVWMVLFTKGGA